MGGLYATPREREGLSLTPESTEACKVEFPARPSSPGAHRAAATQGHEWPKAAGPSPPSLPGSALPTLLGIWAMSEEQQVFLWANICSFEKI